MRDFTAEGDVLAAVIMFVIHAFTLPFTITLGACLKTFVDYFTRKGVSSEQREQMRRTIADLPVEDFNEFKDSLADFPAKSASSQSVIRRLADLDKAKALENESAGQRAERIVAEQKGVLTEYVRAPHNNGKGLLNRMRLFLPAPVPVSSDDDMATQEQAFPH
ncbi:hypothetical protein [Legionella sp. CNM-4043-24]|uniref:hypothetical protein n=1 Tax=Legionella sp. CNM-4043-24 TaxID=3421646 RepID=UPI00403AF7F7